MVAEVDDVRAWSQVALNVVVRGDLRGLDGAALQLHGIVDGALAADAAGQPVDPFFPSWWRRSGRSTRPTRCRSSRGDALPRAAAARRRPHAEHEVVRLLHHRRRVDLRAGSLRARRGRRGAAVRADYHPSRELSEHAEADAIAAILKAVVARQRPKAA